MGCTQQYPFTCACHTQFGSADSAIHPFSILGGIVDRYERRRVFALSEIVQAASVAALPVLLNTSHISIAFVILGVSGLGAVVSGLTRRFMD